MHNYRMYRNETIQNIVYNIQLWYIMSSDHSKMADKFEALEQQLEMFIENTRQLGIIVGDFQPQGQPVLNQKL